jgi:hypothetical protein
MTSSNFDLAKAFSVALRENAIVLSRAFPVPRTTTWTASASIGDETTLTFSVRVGDGMVQIPYRSYQDPETIDQTRFTSSQIELLDCLLTRHHNGFVREKHLIEIVRRNEEWIPPFVIQFAGEYVIEILWAIRDARQDLDSNLYRSFLIANPSFFMLTKQRVTSYWNCYHSHIQREEYAGFQIMKFLDSLIPSDI